MNSRVFLGGIVLFLALLAGFADAHGFVHAANAWQKDQVDWASVAKSALCFGSGIIVYWVSIKFLKQLGVAAAEVQTLLWFGTTLVGVALISRQFLKWQTIDQWVAGVVILGILWLLARTGNA